MNINAPAIFDLKWSYQKIKDTGYLGMADAVGNVTILKLVNDGNNVILKYMLYIIIYYYIIYVNLNIMLLHIY